MSIPNQPTNGLFLTTTPILYSDGDGYDQDQEHATGFFYTEKEETYLVTNRHVIDLYTKNGEKLDSVQIVLRPDCENINKTERRELDIIEDQIEYHENCKIDIAMIPLKEPMLDQDVTINSFYPPTQEFNTGNLALSERALIDPEVKYVKTIHGGSHSVVMGYPHHRPIAPYFPMARNAVIATPYGQQYRNLPLFLTDSKTHGGLSGSPVFTVPRVSTQGSAENTAEQAAKTLEGSAWSFIGIHTGTRDQRNSLGLNETLYSDILRDMIK